MDREKFESKRMGGMDKGNGSRPKHTRSGQAGHSRPGILYILASAVFLLLTLGPFVWAFLVSITPEYEMFTNTPSMLPQEVTLANYAELLNMQSQYSQRFVSGLSNSLRAVLLTLLIGLPVASVTAYALSRMRFAGRHFIKYGLLITMVIPVFATIIPLFRIYSQHRLLDKTFWLALVYVSSFLPMNTWLMSNYFSMIPKELEEAARVDGCSRFGCFFRIILPISYPIFISSALIMFLSAWGQYQIPLILASSAATKPVSIVTSEFMTKDTIFYGVTAAGGLLAILPPAIAAFLFRRFLVNGMMQGSTKG